MRVTGRPILGEGSGLNDAYRRRHRWGSDRVIVLLKPGNAGGGKDPDFWCAFEDGEVRVIGDTPRNTQEDQDPSEKAVSRSQDEAGPRMTLVSPARRMPAMKPVGKPDAGNPHVRLCVQRRLACSAGDKPAGVKVSAP